MLSCAWRMQVRWAQGSNVLSADGSNGIADAVAVAQWSDAVLLVVGLGSQVCGSRSYPILSLLRAPPSRARCSIALEFAICPPLSISPVISATFCSCGCCGHGLSCRAHQLLAP